MPGMENIADLAVVLAQVQLVMIAYHDTRRVLASMLQYQQGIVYRLRHRSLADYPDYSAHTSLPQPALIKN